MRKNYSTIAAVLLFYYYSVVVVVDDDVDVVDVIVIMLAITSIRDRSVESYDVSVIEETIGGCMT